MNTPTQCLCVYGVVFPQVMEYLTFPPLENPKTTRCRTVFWPVTQASFYYYFKMQFISSEVERLPFANLLSFSWLLIWKNVTRLWKRFISWFTAMFFKRSMCGPQRPGLSPRVLLVSSCPLSSRPLSLCVPSVQPPPTGPGAAGPSLPGGAPVPRVTPLLLQWREQAERVLIQSPHTLVVHLFSSSTNERFSILSLPDLNNLMTPNNNLHSWIWLVESGLLPFFSLLSCSLNLLFKLYVSIEKNSKEMHVTIAVSGGVCSADKQQTSVIAPQTADLRKCFIYIHYRSKVWGHPDNFVSSMKTHFYLSNKLNRKCSQDIDEVRNND